MSHGLALALLSACGKGPTPLRFSPSPSPTSPTPVYIRITAAPPPTRTPIPPLEKTAMPTPMPNILPTSLEGAVARAEQDLARRLGLSEGEIILIEAVSDEFPAANLGCPLEGGAQPPPMPALVSGWRILLQARGEAYEYRARGNEIVFCGAR